MEQSKTFYDVQTLQCVSSIMCFKQILLHITSPKHNKKLLILLLEIPSLQSFRSWIIDLVVFEFVNIN